MKFRLYCLVLGLAVASSGCGDRASSKENSYSSGSPGAQAVPPEKENRSGSDAIPKSQAQGDDMNSNKSRTPTPTGAQGGGPTSAPRQ